MIHFLILVALIFIVVMVYRNHYPTDADHAKIISGICMRLYYLIFGSVFVGSIISLTYYYVFTDQTDPDWVRIAIICLLPLPIARLIHITARWVFYGKLN